MRVVEISPTDTAMVGREGHELVLYWPRGKQTVEVSGELFEHMVRTAEQEAKLYVGMQMIAERGRLFRRRMAREVLARCSRP